MDVDLAALQRSGLITEANAQAEGGADVIRFRLAAEPVGGYWMSGPTLGAEAARLAVQLGIGRALVPPSAVDLDADPDEDSDRDGSAQSTPGVPRTPVRLGEGGPLGDGERHPSWPPTSSGTRGRSAPRGSWPS